MGDGGTSKSGKVYHYYSCGVKKKKYTCSKHTEDKGFLEWHVVEQIIKYILQPKRMRMIAENVVAQYDRDFNNDIVKDLERKIARIERDINKLADDFIEAPANSVIRKKISEKTDGLTVQLNDLQIDLSKQRIACGIKLTTEGVIAWLKMFTNGSPLNEGFRDRIIETFLNCVYVYDDMLTLYFNLTSDNQETVCYEVDQGVEVIYSDDDDDDLQGGGGSSGGSTPENEKNTPTNNGQGASSAKSDSVQISNALAER